MRRSLNRKYFFFAALCVLLFAEKVTTQSGTRDILIGSDLTKGFDMGVNTSEGNTTWLTKESDCFKMSFPADQQWAAVFVTYGKPRGIPRPSTDLSAYKVLSIEMKGASGGETVEIGIKSNTQPDNGEEKKVTISLTPKWETYTFPLDKFIGGGLNDLKNLYVLTEFVYNGGSSQIVYFKNIKYLTK